MSWVPALHQASASHGRETMNKTLIQHSGIFSTIKHIISSSQLWWVWVMSGDCQFQEWTFFRKHPFNKRGFNKGGIYLASQLHPLSTQQVSHMTSYCPERNHCAFQGPNIRRRLFAALAGYFHFQFVLTAACERSCLLVCRYIHYTVPWCTVVPLHLPVIRIFETMWKSWIPSDILRITADLLTFSHLSGWQLWDVPKRTCQKTPLRGGRGREQTKGNLWEKGFCVVFETNHLRNLQTSLNMQMASCFSYLTQIDSASYKTTGPRAG